MTQMPVSQLEKLRLSKTEIPKQTITKTTLIDEKSVLKELDLSFDLSNSTATELGFIISNTKNEKPQSAFAPLRVKMSTRQQRPRFLVCH